MLTTLTACVPTEFLTKALVAFIRHPAVILAAANDVYLLIAPLSYVPADYPATPLSRVPIPPVHRAPPGVAEPVRKYLRQCSCLANERVVGRNGVPCASGEVRSVHVNP